MLVLVLLACGHAFECCDDGEVKQCHCAPGANCAEGAPYVVHDDGTCTPGTGDTRDTASTR